MLFILIDEKIKKLGDSWGEMPSRLRMLVKETDSEIKTRRAIDFHAGEKIDEEALKALVRTAASLNEFTAES